MGKIIEKKVNDVYDIALRLTIKNATDIEKRIFTYYN